MSVIFRGPLAAALGLALIHHEAGRGTACDPNQMGPAGKHAWQMAQAQKMAGDFGFPGGAFGPNSFARQADLMLARQMMLARFGGPAGYYGAFANPKGFAQPMKAHTAFGRR